MASAMPSRLAKMRALAPEETRSLLRRFVIRLLLNANLPTAKCPVSRTPFLAAPNPAPPPSLAAGYSQSQTQPAPTRTRSGRAGRIRYCSSARQTKFQVDTQTPASVRAQNQEKARSDAQE